MQAYHLKFNVSNLKKAIDEDFLKYRDVFYKCLIANLCIHNNLYRDISRSTILEDNHYNQHLIYRLKKGQTVEQIVSEMNTQYGVFTLLDTVPFFSEFIEQKHKPNLVNLYHLTIDSTYNVYVTNKHLTIRPRLLGDNGHA